MSFSSIRWNNRTYHKNPRRTVVDLVFTGAADVDANGYTINIGNDVVSSVAKSGEGVIVITTKFPWNELTGVSAFTNDKTKELEYSADNATAATVTLKSVNQSDHDTAVDPDSVKIFTTLTFNASQTDMK